MLRLLNRRTARNNDTESDINIDTVPIINDSNDDSDVSLLMVEDDNVTSNPADNNDLLVSPVETTPNDSPSSILNLSPADNGNSTTSEVGPLSAASETTLPPPTVISPIIPDVTQSLQTQDAISRRSRHGGSQHRSGSSGRRRRRFCRFKRKESNYMAATCNMVAIVLVCIAMVEPRWFFIRGGRCSDMQKTPVDYLGIKMFFYGDSLGSVGNHKTNIYYYGNSQTEVLVECVTANIVFVMKTIIALCFVVILLSLIACLMDLFGPTHVVFKAIRCTASLSILSVSVCVTIAGLCYLVTEQLTSYYESSRLRDTSRVDVEFDVGFYMITAAGAVSVIAVACSLMHVRRSSNTSRRRSFFHSTAAAFDLEAESDQSRLRHERIGPTAATLSASVCSDPSRPPPPYRP